MTALTMKPFLVKGLEKKVVQMYGHVPGNPAKRLLVIGDDIVFAPESNPELYMTDGVFFAKTKAEQYPSGLLLEGGELLQYLPSGHDGVDGVWYLNGGCGHLVTCNLREVMVIAIDGKSENLIVNHLIQRKMMRV